jgi:antitoxin ParD1/3/4
MEVRLSPELQELVESKVRKGEFTSVEHVIEFALHTLQENEAWEQMELEMAQEKIAQGLRSLEEGRGIDGEEAFAELDRRRASKLASRGE